MKTKSAPQKVTKPASKITKKEALLPPSRAARSKRTETVELDLDTAKLLGREAKRRGVSPDDMLEHVIREHMKEKGEVPTVTLTLGFTPEQWETLAKKARMELPNTGEPARWLESTIEVLACDDGCLPVFIPAKIVNRLSDAGDAADLDDFYNGIAISVLGDLAEDPQMLAELVENTWPLKPEDKAALKKLTDQWEKEDAKEKGGQAA